MSGRGKPDSLDALTAQRGPENSRNHRSFSDSNRKPQSRRPVATTGAPNYPSSTSSSSFFNNQKLSLLKARINAGRTIMASSGYEASSRGPSQTRALRPYHSHEDIKLDTAPPSLSPPIYGGNDYRYGSSSSTGHSPHSPLPPRGSKPPAFGSQHSSPSRPSRRIRQPPSTRNTNQQQTKSTATAAAEAMRMAAPSIPADEPPMNLEECPSCHRKFNQTSLARHIKVCKKVFKTKRKTFDSSKRRVTDASPSRHSQLESATGNTKGKGGKTNGGKKGGSAAWRNKSGAIRNAMKAARMVKVAIAKGLDPRDIPNMPTVEVQDDRVPCPHCGRKFGEQQAERHIPKCGDIKAKPNRLTRGGGKGASSGTAAMAAKNSSRSSSKPPKTRRRKNK